MLKLFGANRRNAPRPGTGRGMFADGTTDADLRRYGRLLHRDGVHTRLSDGLWVVTGTIAGRRPVGYTRHGQPTRNLTLIMTADGGVLTMYPVE